MKAFLFDLVNKLQRTSNALDAKAILCNKTWRVFSDTGEKEVYIFMEDGKLVMSVNGVAVVGSWMYIPANQSLVISGNNQNFLVHPIICNNVLALALDGSNQCCFLLDSTKEELDRINSLSNIESYISKNANIIPSLTNTGTANIRNIIIQKPIPSDAIYASDSRLIIYDECTQDGYYHPRLYIKGLLTNKKFTGTIYSSRHHYETEYVDGRLWHFSIYHPNKQLAVEGLFASDDEEDGHYYDENGYEISEKDYNSRYEDYYNKLYKSEATEFDLIPSGGYKDEKNSWFSF